MRRRGQSVGWACALAAAVSWGSTGCTPFLDSADASYGKPGSTNGLHAPVPQAAAQFGASVAVLAGIVVSAAPGTDRGNDEDVDSDVGEAVLFHTTRGREPRAHVLSASDAPPGAGAFIGAENQLLDGMPVPPPAYMSGMTVALTGDAIAVARSGEGEGRGTVRLYSRDGQPFPGPVAPSDSAPYDGFGLGLAISESWLVVGAPGAEATETDEPAPSSGVVYVFPRSGSDTGTPQRLQASLPTRDGLFGFSVAIAGDRILVGAPGEPPEPMVSDSRLHVPCNNCGKGGVYLFRLDPADGVFRLEERVGSSSGAPQQWFGLSVALTESAFAIGAPLQRGCERDAATYGVAYAGVFESGHPRVTQCVAPGEDDNPLPAFGNSVALAGEALLVGAPGAVDPEAPDPAPTGAAYLFSRGTDGTYAAVDVLRPAAAAPGDLFGFAVAVEDGLAAVGAPGASPVRTDEGDNLRGAGTVHVFEL